MAVESPRGEFGCYVCSDGGPQALARAFPRAELRRAPGDRDLHGPRARRRHGRRRRLARHRHGRGRPLVALADQIQEVAARYPDRRSAMLPALRMAQERYGWLSPEALAEVADALDYTTAYCLSVASFYDMFHLEPVGRARGGGVHEPLLCARRCAGRRPGLRVRARDPRRRDDRGRPRDAARRRVPRRLRLRAGGRRSTAATAIP